MEFIQGIDDKILYYIYENWHNGFTDVFFVTVSRLADFGFIWILTAAIMLFNKKWRVGGIVMLISLGVSAVIGSLVLKEIICRMRPFNVDNSLELLVGLPGGYYSFPSGHSTAAGAGAMAVFLQKKSVGVVAIVYGLLLAFSRVFLVVHYPTDVLCGLILGGGCTIIFWKVLYPRIEKLLEKLQKKQPKEET